MFRDAANLGGVVTRSWPESEPISAGKSLGIVVLTCLVVLLVGCFYASFGGGS